MSSRHPNGVGPRSLFSQSSQPRPHAVTTRLSLDGDASHAADTSGVTHHSPYNGLLRFSPVDSVGVNPGVSPYNRSRGGSSQRPSRFFDHQSASKQSSTAAAVASAASEASGSSKKSTTTAAYFGDNSTASASCQGSDFEDGDLIQDGIPIDHLRGLAKQALLDSPSQAIFFANLLYAKTNLPGDGMFLAQTYYSAQEYAACLRVLEESGILQSNYPWEGLLIACSALAATEEWTVLLEIVEDACRLTDTAGNNASFRSIAATQPLMDDDNFGWDALKESIPPPPSAVIHPLARICSWRAQAYYETGHGVRATKYWKKALEMDCQMQKAWDSLLQKNLISSEEAFDLIQTVHFAPEQQWLKALYLASIELTPAGNAETKISSSAMMVDQTVLSEFGFAQQDNTSTNQSFVLHAKNLDESSIHMMGTPMGAAAINKLAGNGRKNNSETTKLAEIQRQVNDAFEKLRTDYQLDQSPQVLAMAARRAYRRYDWKVSLDFCEQLALVDPFMLEAAFCYVATLVMLGYKRVLFRVAHEWVEASPKSAKAWFAVGAYYYCCERYHVAQRHFCRATRLDPQCTEAWIAFGCSFAACDESDQALASFRAAQRLSPGEHTSLLYMGMEYVRTNHLILANYFLQAALTSSSGADPLCLHELGVLASQQGKHSEAVEWFQKALRTAVGGDTIAESIELCLDSYWEPTLYNLGHCYRKNQDFDDASSCYNRCIALCPDKHSTYSAYAFTKHMQGELDSAINYYHQALGRKPEDAFSEGLLTRALQEYLAKSLTVDANTNESTPTATTRPSSVAMRRPSSEEKMDEDSDVDMSAG